MRGRFRATGFAAGFVLSLLARSVSGTERAPIGRAVADCERAQEPSARWHDGFFLRAEAGLALLQAAVFAPGRSGARAIGQSSALSIGGTFVGGLVLGGSIWAGRLDPTFIEGGREVVPDDDSVKLTFARIGPFIGLYPDPGRGFHTDAGLSLLLAVESDEKGNAIEPGFAGPALWLGIGQDWFVAPEFSLGVLARATFGRIARDTSGGSEHLLAEAFELALSYTYH